MTHYVVMLFFGLSAFSIFLPLLMWVVDAYEKHKNVFWLIPIIWLVIFVITSIIFSVFQIAEIGFLFKGVV